ncbi:MAG: UDP-N-acetylglucosamine--LPS N-acetylglucosamine transferase [Pedosphaera sp. Tous-C6FEB]|nr:MAG: UDP-N-acetylglucosamine--LPS N-acetylglucosamine transferase [Pedosphaera sp. Tous-C6FEB]
MKKVLILTAGFGEGHNAAARSLRDALELVAPDTQVEVLDLFESTYGRLNSLVKRAHLGVVRYAPTLWRGIYSLLDHVPMAESGIGGLTRLRIALGDVLRVTQPDVVVSTYPAYAPIIKELFRDHATKPFRLVTIVTDSISVNAAWHRAPSDIFVVANRPTATVLSVAGVDSNIIHPLGFPVSPLFADDKLVPLPLLDDGPIKLLYIINHGKKKCGKVLDRLLENERVHLTITTGRDAELKAELQDRFRASGDRVQVLGWTNQMPQLMLTHHVLIGKAGGAVVQEAIAARCPLVINQIIPGQEEGNARLVQQLGLGTVAERNREVPGLIEDAFAKRGRLWHEWRANLIKHARPDAALRIAELVLRQGDEAGDWSKFAPAPVQLLPDAPPSAVPAIVDGTAARRALLCDFHIHSNYSDGKLTVPELVDFYGPRGFDCICVTDHLADPRRVIGKLSKLSNLVLAESQLEEYFDVLDRERRRAWRKYGMLLLAGIEFNKDGLTKKSSAHLLGIDMQMPIASALDLPETIAQLHAQGALAVASHPHVFKSEWGKNTLYLWENQDEFAPLLDAWEIANRNDIFSPVGLKRLPFIANSDFHKPQHIYSWKTLLQCEKEPDAIKACIRRNEHVSITLYREGGLLPVTTRIGRPAELEERVATRLPAVAMLRSLNA